MPPKGFDYSRFDKVQDSDEESVEEWRLSEAEIKARKEAKREAAVQKELRSYEEIDEKLARAEKLPPRKAEVEPARAPVATGSWSEDRDLLADTDAEKRRDRAKLRQAYRAVEGVLGQMADDGDFQADLKRPSVVKAIKHWTNEARLPPDEAQELFDEQSKDFQFHLKPVLGKLNRLSAACRAAGFGVPMDAVWTARRHPFEKKPEDYAAAAPAPAAPPAKTKRQKAEEAFLKDLPPPTPFTWRAFLRQMAIQFLVMSVVALAFKFHVEPKLEAAAEAQRVIDESSATAGDAAGAPPVGPAAEEFGEL